MDRKLYKQPPQVKAARIDWDEIADLAWANPGQWVRAEAQSSAVAHHIRNGAYKAFRPAYDWEAVARETHTNDAGQVVSDIYVRYMGDDNAAS